MLTGVITEITTDFGAGSTPALTVSGYDNLYPLTVGKNSRHWENKPDSVAVEDLARRSNVATDVRATSPVKLRIDQNNETDMAFVGKLAERNGATFYHRNRKLYFGRRQNDASDVVELDWGQGLLSFRPEANLARQIAEVQVHGWSAAKGEVVIGRARRGEESGRDTRAESGGERVVTALSRTPVLHVRAAVHTQAEADARAKAVLEERAQDFVTGNGESIGVPEILPDTNVALGGLGRAFSKTYYVSAGDPQARRPRLPHDLHGAGVDDLMDAMAWQPAAEAERESDGFLIGLAVGVVTDNKDPDRLARVRVRLPWHTDSDTSFWARSAMPLAGNDRGTYFLPEIGDEVLVGAEDGDPSHLYVLGMLWNGKQAPPVTATTAATTFG